METRLILGLAVGLFFCICAYADMDPAATENAEIEAISSETSEAEASANVAPESSKASEETPAATEPEKTEEAVAPEIETPAPVAEEKTAEEAPAVLVEKIEVEAVEVSAPAVVTETPEATAEEPAEAPAAMKEVEKSEEPAAPAPVAEPATTEPPAATEASKSSDDNKDVCPAGCSCSRICWAILMYIPNRLLDLNDSISMDIGAGAEAAAELGITKYSQFGGSYGSEYFLAKGYNSQYGGGYSSGWSYAIVPPVLDENRYIDEDDCFGTVKPYIIEKDGPHIESRNAEVYKKEYRDFWAIRVSAGWFITAQLEIHPVDLADFVLGFFFIDFKDNDIK